MQSVRLAAAETISSTFSAALDSTAEDAGAEAAGAAELTVVLDVHPAAKIIKPASNAQ